MSQVRANLALADIAADATGLNEATPAFGTIGVRGSTIGRVVLEAVQGGAMVSTPMITNAQSIGSVRPSVNPVQGTQWIGQGDTSSIDVTIQSSIGSGLAIAVGSTLLLGSSVAPSQGIVPIGSNIQRQNPMASTAPVSPVAFTETLVHQVQSLLQDAEYEDQEIGVPSIFSRRLVSLIGGYGRAGLEALEQALERRLPSSSVMSVLLRQLGRLPDVSTRTVRREVLSRLLRSQSIQVRHAAAVGLEELDDPRAIPALERAIAREPYERPRQHLRRVIEQLIETRGGGSISRR